MGCGSSNSVQAATPTLQPSKQVKNENVINSTKIIFSQSSPLPPTPKNNSQQKIQCEDSKSKQTSVSFNISLDANKELDNIFKAPLPRRLQHLTPLVSAPTLTAEDLEMKQRETENRRLKLLEKNNEKIKLAEMKRTKTLHDIKLKQKVRQDRGKRARERVQIMKESGIDDLGVEIEKFKNDSDNEETVPNEKSNGTSDEVNDPVMSSGYSSRDLSASSTKPNINADVHQVQNVANNFNLQKVTDLKRESTPQLERKKDDIESFVKREAVPSDSEMLSDDEDDFFLSKKVNQNLSNNKAILNKDNGSSDSETLSDNDDNSTLNLAHSDNEKQSDKSLDHETNISKVDNEDEDDDEDINGKKKFNLKKDRFENNESSSDVEMEQSNLKNNSSSESNIQSDHDFF